MEKLCLWEQACWVCLYWSSKTSFKCTISKNNRGPFSFSKGGSKEGVGEKLSPTKFKFNHVTGKKSIISVHIMCGCIRVWTQASELPPSCSLKFALRLFHWTAALFSKALSHQLLPQFQKNLSFLSLSLCLVFPCPSTHTLSAADFKVSTHDTETLW